MTIELQNLLNLFYSNFQIIILYFMNIYGFSSSQRLQMPEQKLLTMTVLFECSKLEKEMYSGHCHVFCKKNNGRIQVCNLKLFLAVFWQLIWQFRVCGTRPSRVQLWKFFSSLLLKLNFEQQS